MNGSKPTINEVVHAKVMGQKALLLVGEDDFALFRYRRMATMSGKFYSIRSASNGPKALLHFNEALEGTLPMPNMVIVDLDKSEPAEISF